MCPSALEDLDGEELRRRREVDGVVDRAGLGIDVGENGLAIVAELLGRYWVGDRESKYTA